MASDLAESPLCPRSLPDTFEVPRRKAHGSAVVASNLAPARAPHVHSTAPCHYISKDYPTPNDGAAGHTGGVKGRRKCSGTGRGWGWMGPCGCQASRRSIACPCMPIPNVSGREGGWRDGKGSCACPRRDPLLVAHLLPRESFGQQDGHKAPTSAPPLPLSLQDGVRCYRLWSSTFMIAPAGRGGANVAQFTNRVKTIRTSRLIFSHQPPFSKFPHLAAEALHEPAVM
jgi:hypothetical protein